MPRDRKTADRFGRHQAPPDTRGMRSPVRCTHCGEVYDLGKVTVTARYADCSVWTSPCCRRPGCDDRPGWGGRLGDIEKLY